MVVFSGSEFSAVGITSVLVWFWLVQLVAAIIPIIIAAENAIFSFMSILLFMYPPSLAGLFFVYEVLELFIDPPFQRVGKEHVPFIELLHAIRAVLRGL